MDILNFADTIGQFKILSHIKKNYAYQAIEEGNLELEKVDKNTIRIIDVNKDSITFHYDESTKKIIETEISNSEVQYEI